MIYPYYRFGFIYFWCPVKAVEEALMYRDFQFYDSRIVDYTRIGETLTLFCVYGIHEKWRTCFYRVKDLVGEDFLVGSVISFFGYEHPGCGYTLFFRNSSRTASVVTPEHWRRIQGWEGWHALINSILTACWKVRLFYFILRYYLTNCAPECIISWRSKKIFNTLLKTY